MEQTSQPRSNAANLWDYSMDHDLLALRSVLLVEDDGDIREMIVTLLEMTGFTVVACDTAERGLEALREQEFDLVLADYALPRRSGLWLLQEAESEGLIEGTPALIVTAHRDVDANATYEVIQKPFELDELIARVRQRMEGTGAPRRRRMPLPAPAPGGGTTGGHANGCPEPVELILYIGAQSARSVSAVNTIKKVLERFSASRVNLTVCDLSESRYAGVEDPVAFTPALVRRSPGPRTFILGHITSPEPLLELLADCETEAN
jgi:CheY-like chemotaxis protein